jgi:hypothetical protein
MILSRHDDRKSRMMITFYKTDSTSRLYYYCISDRQWHLFSRYSFTVSWGVALTQGREKTYTFESQVEKETRLREIVAGRVTAGYKVLYTYFRTDEYGGLRSALRSEAAS